MQGNMFEDEMARENAMINAERRDARTSGIMGAITGYGKDLMAADQYDQMVAMMTPDNYKAVVGKDSGFRKLFGVSPTLDMKLSQTTDFKEKGGYLGDIQLFGDDKYEKLMMRVNKNKKK